MSIPHGHWTLTGPYQVVIDISNHLGPAKLLIHILFNSEFLFMSHVSNIQISNIFNDLQHPISAGHVEFPAPIVTPMSESGIGKSKLACLVRFSWRLNRIAEDSHAVRR